MKVKVSYRHSGGFTGLVTGCDLDTGKMAPPEAKKLAALLEDCAGSAPSGPAPEARDAAVHEITVEGDDGARRTLLFDDLNLPPAAAPLLEYLRSRAAPRKPE